MYRPKPFAEDEIETLHQFIQDHPLTTMVTAGPHGILANLIPVNLHKAGEKGTLRCHFARANDQLARMAAGDELLLVFQGPQAYVTPSFYPSKKADGKVVPTWNYTMVQVRGKARIIDEPAWLREQLVTLTASQEAGREHPWKLSDAPDDFVKSIMKAIIGVEIVIETIQGKFKVSQSQSEQNREGVSAGFFSEGKQDMATLVAQRGPKKSPQS